MQDDQIVAHLIGTACSYCDDGTLTDGTFKGDFAVLCDACGTPAYRPIADDEDE